MPRDGPGRGSLDEPLNADQQRAEAEIMESIRLRRTHLLTGDAGAGKTFLVQKLSLNLRHTHNIVLAAPTHQAVSVLRKKLRIAGIEDVECRTIQSVLSLRPKPHFDRLVFERVPNAKAIEADVIVCDECPMVGEDLMQNIERYTPNTTVLFTGDPCQLNPVGERHSRSFEVANHSHLTINERQRRDNPLLDAASILRESQSGKRPDWSWIRTAVHKPYGVYLPSPGNEDAALKRAFTSPEFATDTDTYRYLAWTNQRVADINQKVRRWIYGEHIPTPLMPGERALSRAPVINDDDQILLNTNEEVTVLSIEADDICISLPRRRKLKPWDVTIATWRTRVVNDDDAKIDLHIVRDTKTYTRALERIRAEAVEEPSRWKDFHDIKNTFAVLQSIYAMTVHSSQGSTVKFCFLDIPELRRWSRTDLLESQRGAYVGLTRPTHAAILMGAAE